MNLKPGDRVKMKVGNQYFVGEVTICRESENTCKVLFDYLSENTEPNYDYYPEKDLEKIEKRVYDYRIQNE